MRTRIIAAAASLAAGATFGLASPAAAQPEQNGLINVNISDLDVQVPIGVAANICDVSVAVLAQLALDEAAPCTAAAEPMAITPAGNGGSPRQEGLVNVNVSDITVQIPVGVAANVCDVSVAALTGLAIDDATPCEASANPTSMITRRG
jgi:hypothetical protein